MSGDFVFSDENKEFSLDDSRIGAYVEQLLCPVPEEVNDIVQAMAQDRTVLPLQVSRTDARHLQLLSSMMRPKRILEIGTLFGFSAYFLSLGLAPQGRLFTIEVDPRMAQLARQNLQVLGKSDQVEVITGKAVDVLKTFETEEPFDLIFIDADKVTYPEYLKWAAKNLRSGGLLIADNTFAWGYIADLELPEEIAQDVKGLRKFNYVVANSPLFLTTMLPTHDGMTVALRR